MEFPLPTTLEHREVGYGVVSPWSRAVHRVSHPLDDAPSVAPPTLFQVGNAPGILRSSGVYPHRQARRLITDALPSWRSTSTLPGGQTQLPSRRLARGMLTHEALRAFRALLQRRIRTR